MYETYFLFFIKFHAKISFISSILKHNYNFSYFVTCINLFEIFVLTVKSSPFVEFKKNYSSFKIFKST